MSLRTKCKKEQKDDSVGSHIMCVLLWWWNSADNMWMMVHWVRLSFIGNNAKKINWQGTDFTHFTLFQNPLPDFRTIFSFLRYRTARVFLPHFWFSFLPHAAMEEKLTTVYSTRAKAEKKGKSTQASSPELQVWRGLTPVCKYLHPRAGASFACY